MLVKTSKRSADGANRRRDKRRTQPQLTVRFDGTTYKTLDWSMGGFAIKGGGARRTSSRWNCPATWAVRS